MPSATPLAPVRAGLDAPAPGGSEHTARPPQVSFVSLGCPKALVDSERIVTHLRAEGYALVREHHGADVVIVNTCGFLDSAQAESLAPIAEALTETRTAIVPR